MPAERVGGVDVELSLTCRHAERPENPLGGLFQDRETARSPNLRINSMSNFEKQAWQLHMRSQTLQTFLIGNCDRVDRCCGCGAIAQPTLFFSQLGGNRTFCLG